VLPCVHMGRSTRSAIVGVRELRQNLSVYLGRVKKGEALTVTEHGAAVAILRPVAPASNVLARLVAEGRATPPVRSVRHLPRPLNLRLAKPLAEILDEARDERV
jgi:prevent-host-death family protein